MIFIVAAVAVVRFTPKKIISPRRVWAFLENRLWGPVIYPGYAVGVCLFIPGTLLTTLGGAIFGPYRGFLYVWAGAMLGASAAFWIGRTLGRDLAASLVGDRLKKYDEAIERNGFATTLYLRLVYFPFTPMNFGMGLTRVRFRDYFFGTALGIIVGVFIFTFFVGTVRDVWASGDAEGACFPQSDFSVALFVLSLLHPKIIKKIKGE